MSSTEQRLRELAEKPKNWRAWLLLLAVLAQVAVLAGMYLGARYPVWTGEAVRLQVVPIDPRDLFRGNYARLNYAITSLPTSLIGPEEPAHEALAHEAGHEGLWREGQRVYVSLAEDEHGLWTPTALHTTHPGEGMVLRGRVSWMNQDRLWLTYGLEAWFAPKEKALALEDELRSGGVATVMVARNGRAALVAIDSAEALGLPPVPPLWQNDWEENAAVAPPVVDDEVADPLTVPAVEPEAPAPPE